MSITQVAAQVYASTDLRMTAVAMPCVHGTLPRPWLIPMGLALVSADAINPSPL
jgi:hypothetical protein